MSHTPGPWALELRKDGGFNLIGDGKTLIVEFNKCLTNSPNFIDGNANASLIAAAPELLSALDDITDEIVAYETERGEIHRDLTEAVKRALKVIFKAEGKT